MSEIEKKYPKYKVLEISELIFSYNIFLKIIEKFKNSKLFDFKKIGESFENRDLFLFKIGKGERKVFAWSQMHGNEPVSTMSLFDFMNFLISDDEFNSERKLFLNECTFYFFPLVNPDGANKFNRRNSQGIDLNRDALKMTAPESQVLNKIIDEIKPHFAFNLHDQERYYGTENSSIPTVMSFLSPSFDFNKTIDSHRETAMQVIAEVYLLLKNNLHQGIAKYNDDYMPNAFGDNVQKKKISTILFEAGYIISDEKRQKVRKNYFLSIYYAVKSISNKSYKNFNIADYQEIPQNIKLKFVDIIIRNVTIRRKTEKFTTDIAISKKSSDTEQFSDTLNDYIITDIGDLSRKVAFKEINSYILNDITDENYKIKRLNKADFLLDYFNIK